MREQIEQRAAELRRQADDVKRQAEMQITALLTAAAELERLLTLDVSEQPTPDDGVSQL